MEKMIELISSAESLKVSVDHLNKVVTDHGSDIASLRQSIDMLNITLAAHSERENVQTRTLEGVVRFIIGASTFAFISMVSAIAWLLTHSNPWINM